MHASAKRENTACPQCRISSYPFLFEFIPKDWINCILFRCQRNGKIYPFSISQPKEKQDTVSILPTEHHSNKCRDHTEQNKLCDNFLLFGFGIGSDSSPTFGPRNDLPPNKLAEAYGIYFVAHDNERYNQRPTRVSVQRRMTLLPLRPGRTHWTPAKGAAAPVPQKGNIRSDTLLPCRGRVSNSTHLTKTTLFDQLVPMLDPGNIRL